MKKEASIDSKARILNIAEKIFADKGFDGARVDEIAQRAKVNKALIYYYYKNKEAIRDELYNRFIIELKVKIEESIEQFMDLSNQEKYKNIFINYVRFFDKRRDTIRIMTMESLKKMTFKQEPLFQFMDIMMQDEREKVLAILEESGYNIDTFVYDEKQLIITDFFTGLLPIINFVNYKDHCKEHYQMDEEEIYDKFYEAYKVTHLAYHRAEMTKLAKSKK